MFLKNIANKSEQQEDKEYFIILQKDWDFAICAFSNIPTLSYSSPANDIEIITLFVNINIHITTVINF